MTTYYAQGPYRAEVIDQGLSQSSTGNPQIFLRIQILESLDINPITVEQYERTIYWTLTEKTIEFTLDKLVQLGFKGASFRQLDPLHQGHHSFIGQQIEVYCKIELYQGKEREKWDLSFSGGGPEPLDEAEARKLDAMFGRKLKEKCGAAAASTGMQPNDDPPPKPQGVSAAQARAAKAAAVEEDSIPF